MVEPILQAKSREIPTKEINLQRQDGFIPAVVYGGDAEKNYHLTLNKVEFEKVYRNAGESTMIDLTIDGQPGIKVLVKDVQHDPVSDDITHADLYKVNLNKEINAYVPLVFTGISPAVKDMNGILVTSIEEVEITCLPKDLLHEIVVDISGLATFDDMIKVSDLKIPAEVKIHLESERTVATVVPVKEEKEQPVAEAVAEGAEGEVKEGAEGDKKEGDGEDKKE